MKKPSGKPEKDAGSCGSREKRKDFRKVAQKRLHEIMLSVQYFKLWLTNGKNHSMMYP